MALNAHAIEIVTYRLCGTSFLVRIVGVAGEVPYLNDPILATTLVSAI